eukprot:scaffold1189_cov315-Prasinococcus_capsulatus_cf.AAC.4
MEGGGGEISGGEGVRLHGDAAAAYCKRLSASASPRASSPAQRPRRKGRERAGAFGTRPRKLHARRLGVAASRCGARRLSPRHLARVRAMIRLRATAHRWAERNPSRRPAAAAAADEDDAGAECGRGGRGGAMRD